ncbi:MAG: hypothetical protein EPO22_04490 [Dehalococcoidia bacterium]|nr:MAG: hypothetical protein EPO22_04490 [Dehalococcoidia bacterium]
MNDHLPRRLHRALAFAVAAFIVATLLGACGGSGANGDVEFPKVITLGKGDIFPSIVNHALGVGPNRVSIGLTDRDDRKILDATLHVRFYLLNNDQQVLKSESDARFVPAELSYIDEGAGNARTPVGRDGVYVVNTTFDEAGDWGMLVTVTRNGKTEKPIPFRFNVLDHTPEPGIGDIAPPSRQATLAGVSDITDIDTSSPPRPSMHNITVADALAANQPVVVAFATPAFCESRTCEPVMETIMDPLSAKYAGRATFIHIEPYDLKQLREANVQIPVPATQEWRLQDEPWVFIVDRSGRIAAKFEGITALDEVEAALQAALAASPQ